jgi:hypothetical protein
MRMINLAWVLIIGSVPLGERSFFIPIPRTIGIPSLMLTYPNRIGANSSTSVVDKNCKVWNTDNLFVLDAGIIPSQPMSNTHAAVMTVAEMGVARILALSGGA